MICLNLSLGSFPAEREAASQNFFRKKDSFDEKINNNFASLL